jgi:hypothetical protein
MFGDQEQGMDTERLIFAAATGAVIGLATVAALAATQTIVAANGPHRILRQAQSWPMRAAIVLGCAVLYAFVGTAGRAVPAPPVETAPPPNSNEAGPAQALPAGPASFDVGGVTLGLNPPAGYCRYSDDMMKSAVTQQARVNPDNLIDAVFGDCGELRAQIATGARIENFGIVMTPKTTATRDFDANALDQTIEAQIDPATVKETLDQRLGRAQSNLSLQSLAPLGMIERDGDAAYFAFLTKASQGDDRFQQACVMAMLTLKGRLVTYYLYADYTKDPRGALLTLLQKTKAGVGDFERLNGAGAEAETSTAPNPNDVTVIDTMPYVSGREPHPLGTLPADRNPAYPGN